MNWYCFWIFLENKKFDWEFKSHLLSHITCNFLDWFNCGTHKFFCLSYSFLIVHLLQIKRSIIWWHFSFIFPSFFFDNLNTVATFHVLLDLLKKIGVLASRTYKLEKLHQVFDFLVDINGFLHVETTRTLNLLIGRDALWTEKHLAIEIRTLFSIKYNGLAIFTDKVMNQALHRSWLELLFSHN